jgi:hypothetical protein
MKTSTVSVLLLVLTLYAFPVYAGIRCKNDLISIGATSSEVMVKLSRCGEVLNKEVVRKETSVDTDEKESVGKVKKEILIELWYIRVNERGGMYCYPLTFEEGRLQSVGRWSKCD